jgi:O-antigen ligase
MNSQPRTASAATPAGVMVYRVSLALFLAIAVARMHDFISVLEYFRPGKLLVLPLLLTLVVALPRWQLFAAMRTTTAKCIGVMVAVAGLSIPLALWPSNSAHAFAQALVPALVLFAVIAVGFADRRTAGLCILSFVLAVGIDALYLLVGPAPTKAGRPYIGPALDPNDSAALFVTTLPWAMLLMSDRGVKRFLGLAVAILLAAGVVATGSRGGVVGLVTVGLLLIVRAERKRRWTYVFVVAACAAAFALTADEARRERFETIFAPKTDYNMTEREGRIQVWQRGLRYMATHALLGVGLDNFEIAEGVLGRDQNAHHGVRYTAAHNAFIQVGAELGVIGLAAFAFGLWSAGRDCRRVQRLAALDRNTHPQIAAMEERLSATAFCSLCGLVTTMCFLSLAYHPITLFALGACVGVRAGSPYAAYEAPWVMRAVRIFPIPPRRDGGGLVHAAGGTAR